MTEFDYRREAANMDEVRANVEPRFGHRVALPRPHTDLCTKEVLVMSRLRGVKLADGLREAYAAYAEQHGGASAEALESAQASAVDPQFGRSLSGHSLAVRRANALGLAADCLLSANPLRLAWNLSPLRLLFGRAEYRWSARLPNLGDLLQLLLDVHASEILHDGVFNADPHPGNILLMPDGRLGLLDYGQTKRLPLSTRLSFAKLIVALCVDDRTEVVRLIRDEFGASSARSVDDVTYRLAAFWLDRDTEDVTGPRNLQQFLDWCEAEDPIVTTADDIVMASRVSVLLRGMVRPLSSCLPPPASLPCLHRLRAQCTSLVLQANAFGIRLRVAPAWRRAAEDLLHRNNVEYPLTKLPTVSTGDMKAAQPAS